jgi:trimeric autotransporter adhesin
MYLVINNLNTSIISNPNGSISASGGTNFQWLNCTTNQIIIGANNAIFSPIQNGSYAAIVSNNSGCSDTTACVNFSISGLKQTYIFSTSIYPNPSKEVVTIAFTENKAQLEVTDALGKIKLIQTIQNGEAISMKDWPVGIYFFKLKTENGVSNQKVVKR